jgi:hypothetical protein
VGTGDAVSHPGCGSSNPPPSLGRGAAGPRLDRHRRLGREPPLDRLHPVFAGHVHPLPERARLRVRKPRRRNR